MAKKSQKFIVAKSITEYASKDEAAAALVDAKDDGLVLVIGNVVPFKIETNPRLVFESAPKKERKARAPRGDKAAAAAPTIAPEVVDKVRAVIAQPKKMGEIVTESGLDKEVVSAALASMGATKDGKGRGTTYTYVPGTATVPPPPPVPTASA